MNVWFWLFWGLFVLFLLARVQLWSVRQQMQALLRDRLNRTLTAPIPKTMVQPRRKSPHPEIAKAWELAKKQREQSP